MDNRDEEEGHSAENKEGVSSNPDGKDKKKKKPSQDPDSEDSVEVEGLPQGAVPVPPEALEKDEAEIWVPIEPLRSEDADKIDPQIVQHTGSKVDAGQTRPDPSQEGSMSYIESLFFQSSPHGTANEEAAADQHQPSDQHQAQPEGSPTQSFGLQGLSSFPSFDQGCSQQPAPGKESCGECGCPDPHSHRRPSNPFGSAGAVGSPTDLHGSPSHQSSDVDPTQHFGQPAAAQDNPDLHEPPQSPVADLEPGSKRPHGEDETTDEPEASNPPAKKKAKPKAKPKRRRGGKPAKRRGGKRR